MNAQTDLPKSTTVTSVSREQQVRRDCERQSPNEDGNESSACLPAIVVAQCLQLEEKPEEKGGKSECEEPWMTIQDASACAEQFEHAAWA